MINFMFGNIDDILSLSNVEIVFTMTHDIRLVGLSKPHNIYVDQLLTAELQSQVHVKPRCCFTRYMDVILAMSIVLTM